MIARLLKSTYSGQLHGGLRFHKMPAPQIETIPVPDILIIPIKQHQGSPGNIIVSQGQHVSVGQALTASQHLAEVPVHASGTGIIETISATHIAINIDQHAIKPGVSPQAISPVITKQQLIDRVHHHGITGLGGAGFPTAKKIENLHPEPKVLLVNAAECDPIIHCDDILMQNHANEIVSGLQLVANACQIPMVIIGIEDNKHLAKKAMELALEKAEVPARIVIVPAVYPSGAENQLAQLCIGGHTFDTDQNSTSNLSLSETGILSLNVATCFAIYQALYFDTPLISRIVSIVDHAGNTRNFQLPVGTSISHLYQHIYSDAQNLPVSSFRITSGGQMMGTLVSIDDVIQKSTNCIAFSDSNPPPIQPCIRCGACADVCPELLLPQQLYVYALHNEQRSLAEHRLNSCIECGCCDTVCPSKIPLTSAFQQAKKHVRESATAQHLADLAKTRFEKRQQRLSNKNKLRTRNGSIKKSLPKQESIEHASVDADLRRKKMIAAALDRKRGAASDKPDDHGNRR